MNQYDNLPWDLKACPHWVCWTYVERDGKKTKFPIDPKSGQPASTADPATWATFEAARSVAESHSGVGIGFVFTGSPFAGIDLDATDDPTLLAWHQSIAASFQSYSERSPSGKGLHIIVRGGVPHGKKDTSKKVEIYSEGRFFTMTGDVYSQFPISERNEQLNELWNQLGGGAPGTAPSVESQPSNLSDDEIIARASRAANSETFRRLWSGDTSGHNNDHSAADQALFNILAFYTKDHDQAVRIFQRSSLGQRDKAKRKDYLARTLARAYDGGIPSLNTSNVEKFKARMAQPIEAEEPEEIEIDDPEITNFELTPDESISWPPGLVGRLAQEIHSMSLYPRRRVSIASALSLMSLICGRSWAAGNMGLNLYLVLLGKTGLGKSDGINSVYRVCQQIDQFAKSVNQQSQMAPRLRKEFISKQGMHRDLAEHKSVLWVIDEFQIRLSAMLKANSISPDYGIKSFLTANYTESGPFGSISAMTYSKKENSFGSVDRPNLNLFGLGVPNQFWSCVGFEHLQDGFLNRLVLLECPEEEDSTRNRAPVSGVSDQTLGVLTDMVYQSLNPHNTGIVAMDDDVRETDFAYSEYYRLNGSETAKMATARVCMNSMKIAALIAIGNNPHSPVITMYDYQWAHKLVTESAFRMLRKFDSGDIGSGDGRCIADIKQVIKGYFDPKSKNKTASISKRHIRKYSSGYKSLRDHPRGAIIALDMALKSLEEDGIIRQVPGPRGGVNYELAAKWARI